MLLMGERGLSQTVLARRAGVSVQFVNYILLGKKVSAPVQTVIASSLGFESWERLSSAALMFSDNFANMYNVPTKRPIKETEYVDRHEVAI
jgi:transcriptional regulator with XRE-family HTH domain